MIATKEQRKAKAIEIMKQLGIYKPYIQDFEQYNQVCLYENFAGFWVYQFPELEAKMKEIEQKYNCTVFAITHEYTDFGELYDFILIPKYKEDWDHMFYSLKQEHIVYAYVWNKSDEWCSEFGGISVQSFGGGIRRIA